MVSCEFLCLALFADPALKEHSGCVPGQGTGVEERDARKDPGASSD